MARSFHKHKPLGALTEVNVTPLIDLAFALLIIFMITTPLIQQKIEIDLPLESKRPQKVDPEVGLQTISVNSKGEYFWGETPVSEALLDQYLSRLAAQPNPPVLSIRGDRRVPYQKVITVVDLIKRRNLTQISLDTQAR